MKKTKIDWCDSTLNPVIGCKNGCPYCFARTLNNRFKFIPKWEEPQFFFKRLLELNSKKPQSIFMDSMSDIGHWENEWLVRTFDEIICNSQHAYIFLTKNSYGRHIDYIKGLRSAKLLPNVFIGKSVTHSCEVSLGFFDFFSVEPILAPIRLTLKYAGVRAVIIGAETGNRKDKVVPEKWWIDDIVEECDDNGVAVFMKESLRELMGKDFRQDKLPWYDWTERRAVK